MNFGNYFMYNQFIVEHEGLSHYSPHEIIAPPPHYGIIAMIWGYRLSDH